jgi:hypothetical protein
MLQVIDLLTFAQTAAAANQEGGASGMKKVIAFFKCANTHLHSREFWYGALVAAVILIALWLIFKIYRFFRGGCGALVVKDANGTFSVQVKALQSFLNGVVADLKGIDLDRVRLFRAHGGFRVDCYFKADTGADLVLLRNTVPGRIRGEIADKLGISQQIKTVNVFFSSLPNSNKLAAGGGNSTAAYEAKFAEERAKAEAEARERAEQQATEDARAIAAQQQQVEQQAAQDADALRTNNDDQPQQ